MNKFLKDEHGPYTPPSVTEQIKRLEGALGPEWAIKLGVAQETVRTWKKRGAIPITQLANASQLSGRPIEWFKMNRYLAESEPDSFFSHIEKQITQCIDADELPSKTDPGQPGKDAMQRLQASTETIKRVSAALGYEPPMIWTALIQELMFSHGLSEDGVYRIMESLKSERKARNE